MLLLYKYVLLMQVHEVKSITYLNGMKFNKLFLVVFCLYFLKYVIKCNISTFFLSISLNPWNLFLYEEGYHIMNTLSYHPLFPCILDLSIAYFFGWNYLEYLIWYKFSHYYDILESLVLLYGCINHRCTALHVHSNNTLQKIHL